MTVFRRTAGLVLATSILLPFGAEAQRFQQPTVERKGMTCSQMHGRCLARASQQTCDAQRQGCLATGTWQGAAEISTGLERR